jgi:hypothetical protein
MATSEERIKILKMVQEGKINAEEATRLLESLARPGPQAERTRTDPSRWIRLRVTGIQGRESALNVTLPLAMIDVLLRLGARFLPEDADFDLEELARALQQGATGKILDLDDEINGHRVEIFIE